MVSHREGGCHDGDDQMSSIYRFVLLLHVCAGIAGLIAFWVPAVARKGKTVHVQVGRAFFYATCIVAATGIGMASLLLADPLATKPLTSPVPPERAAAIASTIRLTALFLFYLVLITFVPVHHGVRVLATRHAPERLRTPFHTAINVAVIVAAAGMVVLGVTMRQPVFALLSVIGFLVGPGNLRFARRPYSTPMAWWYEHMGSMLGGGVAFHTAFLVLGAGRLFGITLDGPSAIVPWILPTIVGVPATSIWVGYYRRRFRETAAAGLAAMRPA
jgi:hypothetical protein